MTSRGRVIQIKRQYLVKRHGLVLIMTRAHLLGRYLLERLPAGVRDIERALQMQQEMSLQGVSKPIARILADERLIDNKQLDEALRKQKQDFLLSMSLFESAPPESISVISKIAPC